MPREVSDAMLVEPVAIPDDFVQGIDHIEVIGPCARFVLYTNHTVPEDGGRVVRVTVRKIVVPVDLLPGMVRMAGQFIARQAAGRASKLVSAH